MTETVEPDLFDRYVQQRQSITDPYELSTAIVSKAAHENGKAIYRYALERVWDSNRPLLLWIMLNPSTADAFNDDRTIGRCVSFAKTYGMGAIRVINLFAYRATDPDDLWAAHDAGVDIVGPQNRELIVGDLAGMNALAGLTIVAWGAQVDRRPIGQEMVEFVREHYYGAWSLGVTKGSHPRHPLYVDGATALDAW